MTTLVIHSHPHEISFSVAVLEAVLEQVPTANVIRLGRGENLNARSFDDVTKLIAVYPTWWGSVPAALLGPLTELLGPWVDGSEPASSSPLRLVESITVVTTHGSSKLVNQLQGEPGMHLWKRVVLPACAPGAAFRWQPFYKMDRASDRDRQSFLDAIDVA